MLRDSGLCSYTVPLLLLSLALSGCATTARNANSAAEFLHPSLNKATVPDTPLSTPPVSTGAAFAPGDSLLGHSSRPAIMASAVGLSSGSMMTEKQEVGIAEPVKQFVFVESLFGICSFLFSKNPHEWGAFEALIFPYVALSGFADPKAGPIEPWLGLGGVGALIVYDLKVDETRTSQNEIFRTNFAGMNAVGAIILTTRYLAGNFKNDKKFSFTYVPASHGGKLFLTYRF